MKHKKPSFSFIHMGAPSLLMIFLVLCLFTFALLSLSSAKNNRTLSQQSADRIQAYYQASSALPIYLLWQNRHSTRLIPFSLIPIKTVAQNPLMLRFIRKN